MFLISERLKSVQPSPTLEVSRLAAELRSQGVDVISLGAGEPDFDTPDHVKEAAIAAIHAGKTKYAPVDGIPELKEAVVLSIQSDYGLTYSTDQVLIGSGAKQCIYNLFMATLDPGDEVIIPAPYWVSYTDIVSISGGKPVVVDCGEEFKLTADLLERAITPRTKWLIINSPSNPTGVVYSRDDLRAIADVLLKHPTVYVMTDDIYAKLVYDVEFVNILQVESALYDRVVIVNGVSKSHAMTGWRIGYIAGDARVIKAMSTIQSQSTTTANSIAQVAAVTALSGDSGFLDHRCKIFSKRRDMVMKAVEDSKILKAQLPHGAFYVFVSCKGAVGKRAEGFVIANGTDFAKYLLQHKVAVVPGVAFGAPDFFRISYALADDELSRACDRIVSACAALL
ncbi:pyridoxal phosphate-dependent aminotransferase [Anaplasma marginale]|uniref:pyridoxal phosphate-dependent aminotransferase n=1 Tax=Anaplasma marginale TaxID=770 RepID=UPI0011ED7D43|nr:pyridoxal phosphate-dependent aminotransferase [Anaplasma marginale]KAA8473204.1 pyridoxal phosphate-dependent aminotransferase [Anaplasma marginale]KAB0451567.1 pyridoxal phosphate-dependent aminotransferase [Anaplasma marginale]KAB0453448.1 pyridoxal phosphate-dependent aminotransferase [Anaplasma marginale]TZF79374.1 pyridoxal phosphate-dependent aminotransferase [Anaplasma marginale]